MEAEGRKPEDRTKLVIFVLFFLSGAGSLVYQVVWVRMLVLVFGTTVFAVSTVLSAFMAGLALGSFAFGRLVDRRGNGLRLYAGLELGIGLVALLLIPLFAELDGLYTAAYRLLDGQPYLFALFRFGLSFLVLLVPTTLIGGTLPVLSKFVARRLPRVGRAVGGLYAINTFGAVAGCVLAAFVLLERFGIRGTVFVIAALNLFVALASFLLSLRGSRFEDSARHRDASSADRERPVAGAAGPAIRAVFWGYAASGFVALGYEVLWSRLLSIVMRNTTTQSLSTTLIVFLFGLAVGGAVMARVVDRWSNLLAAFGITELLLGLYGLASVAVFTAIPRLSAALGPAYGWWGHVARLLIVACFAMLIPTFLMGTLFPIVGKLHVRALGSIGRRVGGIFAANTAGAILGAFAAGFVLIPLLGSRWSIQLLAWGNIGIGVTVLLLDPSMRRRSRNLVLATAGVLALALTALTPSGWLVDLYGPRVPGELLYHDEGAAGTVTVVEYDDGNRLLRVNGAGEVPTDHQSIQIFRLLGSLPFLIHPQPEEALVIAFGGGVTLASVEASGPRHVECVDVVPGVVGGAEYFSAFNNRVFERLGGGVIEFIADDGRNHVLRTPRTYDVLISDSTHPSTADSWVLYTEEFYELCKARLKPGGYVAQWVPLHGLTAEDYKIVVRTFRSVFPHTTLWLNARYSILLGSPTRLRIDYRRLRERIESPALRASLDEVDLGDPTSFLAALALDEDAVASFAEEGPINTDDRALLGFRDRERTGSNQGLPALASLVPYLDDGAPHVFGVPPRESRALRRRLLSRNQMFVGVVLSRLGDMPKAVEHLRRARDSDLRNRAAERMLEAFTGGSSSNAGSASGGSEPR